MTRHSVVGPVSARNIVGAYLIRNPITEAELVEILGVSDKALRRVLDGKRPGVKFARRWREETGQDLMQAWRNFEAWERERPAEGVEVSRETTIPGAQEGQGATTARDGDPRLGPCRCGGAGVIVPAHHDGWGQIECDSCDRIEFGWTVERAVSKWNNAR